MPSPLATATIPPAVREVLSGLTGAGYRAFLVGGGVRDLLRGAAPKDFDVATSATPEQVQACFRRVIPTGIAHGTVTVVVKGTHVEVTTFRTEAEYVDGRRPSSVAFHTDITADLSRRDFTINAMAYDPIADELVDPFGGQGDLRAELVRCVGAAAARFGEDGLRALRAVRFATVLQFELDPGTEAAIQPSLSVFRKVAGERVQQEFVKILTAPHVGRGLELLRRTGLLGVFMPEAVEIAPAQVAAAPPTVVLRLAVLLAAHTSPRSVVMRLKFSRDEAETVEHLVRHQRLPDGQSSDADLRRWLAGADPQHLEALLALNTAVGRDAA
ncbi:MAG: [cytidine(C)-cytidine(C)-adenosine (A)]-adding enzyme, partial [Archangium sp.]|nr:[cytidine(C)-cytidine(C)-adenosine (A)]-adding enzyme [Archangium sp.]